MQKKMIKLSIILSISLILISSSVNASNFRPQDYGGHQTVGDTIESVNVSADGLHVTFKGTILIDKKIHNKTDWVSFTFDPTPIYRERFEDFESSLKLGTVGNNNIYAINNEVKYTRIEDTNNSSFIY